MAVVVSDKFAKALKTYKNKDVGGLVGRVERMLLARPVWESRVKDRIHVSELSESDFCPRAVWHRIKTGVVHDDSVLSREIIFAEGNEYHRKWQGWAWDVGLLAGTFECLRCDHRWHDHAPDVCAECEAPRKYLAYDEVFLSSEEYRLVGSTDGVLIYDGEDEEPKSLLEIKSVGPGTLRMMRSDLLIRNTHEFDGRKIVDWTGVWRGLKRPLSQHVRQVFLYVFLYNLEHPDDPITRVVILYEDKSTGRPKQFVLKYDEGVVEPLLRDCISLIRSLDTDKEPECPTDGCKECKPYTSPPAETRDEDAGSRRVRGVDGDERLSLTRRPRVGAAPGKAGRRRVDGRPDTDGDLRGDERVGGVHQLLAGSRRHRR